MNPCPVCGCEMKHSKDTLDGWCTLEESYICPNGCYSYSYETGVTEVFVGKKFLAWNYNTPYKDIERLNKIINRLVEREKKKRKE